MEGGCESRVGKGTGAAAALSAAMNEQDIAASTEREKDEDACWPLGRTGCRTLILLVNLPCAPRVPHTVPCRAATYGLTVWIVIH
jgi:hypothetical protein